MTRLLPIALLLSGCGLLGDLFDSDKTAAELRQAANERRRELNALAADARDAYLGVQVACGYQDRVQALQGVCKKAPRAMDVLDRVWWAAWFALAAYESGVGTLDAADDMIAAVGNVLDALHGLTEEARRYEESIGSNLESLGPARDRAGAESNGEARSQGQAATADPAAQGVSDAGVAGVPLRGVDAADPWAEQRPAGVAGQGATGDAGMGAGGEVQEAGEVAP